MISNAGNSLIGYVYFSVELVSALIQSWIGEENFFTLVKPAL